MTLKVRAWDRGLKMMVRVTVILFDSQEIDFEGNLKEPYSMHHFELMENTGLNDKNGKEIFEGDILGHSEGLIIVKWYQDHAGFGLLPTNQNCEVLGNIYENPELIKI